MTTTEKRALQLNIDDLLAQLSAEKRAEANTEAGGYSSGTTHPVKDVDDRTDTAQEGARSSENTEDVKTEPNRGQTVDEASEGPGAGQDSVQLDIGITSKATGEDSSAETDSAKDGKEDGGYEAGSSHPARTDNEALDGHKYAGLSDIDKLEALCKEAEALGSEICAIMAVEADKRASENSKKPDPKGAGNTNSQAGGVGVKDGPRTEDGKIEAKAASEEEKAAAAGADLARIFANFDVPLEDKQAADALVFNTVSDVISVAHRRAQKCAEFYAGAFSKRAEGEEYPEEGGDEEGGGEGGGSEEEAAMQAMAGPEMGGGGGLEELLAGGEGMGAEDAAGGMGLEGGGMGAPPEAGGGMPGAEMGGGGEAELAQLEAILQELGITPEELEMAIAGKQAAALKQKRAKEAASKLKDPKAKAKYAAMKNLVKELVGSK